MTGGRQPPAGEGASGEPPRRAGVDVIAPVAAVVVCGLAAAAIVPSSLVPTPLARAATGVAGVALVAAAFRLADAGLRRLVRAVQGADRSRTVRRWERWRPARAPGPGARRWLWLAFSALGAAAVPLWWSAAAPFHAVPRWALLVFSVSGAVALVAAAAAIVLAVILAAERRFAPAAEVVAVVGGLATAAFLVAWGGELPGGDRDEDGSAAPRGAAPGIQAFSYGPGDDQRPAYGREARIITPRVDLSALVPEGWTAERTARLGFDPRRLPVAGRAWVPEGAAAAPLVLLVHGTHDMRVASEVGFGWLAEALARRGFVVASVDQGFLGYGFLEAGELRGSDIAARAELVLAHLEVWHALSTDPSSPLGGTVDLDRVLLVGHSRGGEAVVAASNALAARAGEPRYRVRALVALAPTENDGPRPFAADVSYLTVHGDLDNDVEAFVGLRAYHRLRLARAQRDGPRRLKVAVLLGGANHAHFNTAWGGSDTRWPSSLLERRRGRLPGPAQRRATALLVEWFAEAALLDSPVARERLRHARRELARDPGVEVRAAYRDAAGELLASFDEDPDPETATAPGARIEVAGLSRWAEHDPPLRLAEHFGTRMSRALEVVWGRGGAAAGAPTLAVALPDRVAPDRDATGSLAFALAYPSAPPALDVRLVDADGRAAVLAVGDRFPLAPRRKDRFTILGVLEPPSAPTFLETVILPLSAFLEREPALDLTRLRRVEFLFRSAAGTARIDDVQLWPRRLAPDAADREPR